MSLKINKNYILGYFIAFFALWCIRELWLVQYLDLMDSVPRALSSAVIKVVIWIIPVLILVKVMEKADPFSYLGLRHNFRSGLKWTFCVSLVFISYFIILNFTVLHNNLDFRIGINELLNTVL